MKEMLALLVQEKRLMHFLSKKQKRQFTDIKIQKQNETSPERCLKVDVTNGESFKYKHYTKLPWPMARLINFLIKNKHPRVN